MLDINHRFFYKTLIKNILYRFGVISISATKEEQLQNFLKKMKKEWETITLSTSPHKYDICIVTYYIMYYCIITSY